ncbi:MAG TPA: inositol 2-dehydrogenase [Candidatus Limnocylindrales bacterium]|nr:inositol 2-dehydrogenase [Candidatus Limnocylindrales bacterium]
MKFAVLGAGRIGKIHAETLALTLPDTEVAAIADPVKSAADETASRLGIPVSSADSSAVIQRDDIEAVVICSSTDTHVQYIIEAARAGKHIFSEKPIDMNLARIDEALEAVEQAGVKLQIGFNRRFDANFARIRKAITDGEIGTPHRLHIVSRDPGPPPISYVKVSGGMMLDMTIHDFDMARFLIGSEVEEIYATAKVMIDPAIGEAGDVDTALAVLKFANGVIGTIDNSRKAVYGYDQRVEVFGSGGKIEADNNYPNSALVSTAASVYRDLPLNFFLERYKQSYITEMRAFVDAITSGGPVPVTGYDGRVPVVMAKAARLSIDLNRPVKLSEVGG